MQHAVRGFGLAASLALVSTLAVVPQARAASTSSPAAYVYIQIQGTAGAVYGFSASSTGQLTAISGAPWKPSGQIIGGNKSQFFTLGDQNLYSYGITSNGGIGSVIGQVPVLDYAGGSCGSGASGGDGAQLDHTGSNIYVLLENGSNFDCAAYQTYNITKAGYFDFAGDTEITFPDQEQEGDYDFGLPSILGNETFAYSQYLDNYGPIVSGFQRSSSGTLEVLSNFKVNVPTNSGGQGYVATSPDASPAGNYVMLQLYPEDAPPGQLGVFTVNSEGDLSTTNTSSNMPTMPFSPKGTTFSPTGNLFVIWGDDGSDSGSGNGIQIYNFNGAAALAPYKTLLSGTPIDQVAWDRSNHMYAISQAENKLYVFTVTPTSVTQDTAWSIGSPYKMVVVSE
ncbi:MAG: hypothetical protein ABSF28_09365 [Terracidiphilus sp.]|jgi:hypothetical protein